MIYSRPGAATATVLAYAAFEEWNSRSCAVPQTPGSRELLDFASFLCSVESWKLPNSLLGLASCSHVFGSHVIVYEVTVPHACTIHNGKTCVVQCKVSNEDILDLPAILWGKQFGTGYCFPRRREQKQNALQQLD